MSIADRQIHKQVETQKQIVYPDSDGQPMADNTLQFQWIVAITGSISRIFQDDPHVFVAGDLLWYPVEGNNKLRVAPDTLVAFGRPKGHRGSYRQWVEDNVAPQVVFEVLSPGNRFSEMLRKFDFYDRYGVDEYYIIDPDNQQMEGWIRKDGKLQTIDELNGWVSPRLGVRFAFVDDVIQLFQPDGQRFLTYEEVAVELRNAIEAAAQARLVAEQETARANLEKSRADEQQARANEQQARANEQQARADRLAARLRELGEAYD